jgi:ferric-dicitrate binding protein FerR (iron transport regulator)
MKDNYPNIDPKDGIMHDRFFRHAGVPYERSREQVWEALEGKLDRAPLGHVVRYRFSTAAKVAAAIILLLAGTFLVLRFYSVSVSIPAGEQLAYTLPGGSTVELNAESRLSYRPFWWRYSRTVRFEGEGYFTVEKGSEFRVASEQGITTVLGTRFNIFSRNDEYRVTCFSGSVSVTSKTDREVVLRPEYQASVLPDGNIMVSKEARPGQARSWMEGMFHFTARPLGQVFDEIERQYSVKIDFEPASGYQYTGFFSMEKPVEEVLELVCKPFGLNFARTSDKTYEVFSN